MIEKVSFAHRLREGLALRKLQQKDLSDRTGIPKSALSQYCSGSFVPKQNRTALIAKVLNVNEAWLMGYDVPMERLPDPQKTKLPPNAIPFSPTGRVPIYGTIPAGPSAVMEEEVLGYESVEVSDPENYFCLKVSGDSMINAGILNGDIVLVKYQPTAENGQIVACRVNGDEATLKRFKRQGKSVVLLPENPKYDPRIVGGDEFESGYASIIGVAVEVRHKL